MHCIVGPKRNKKPRWVPAVVTKIQGSRTVNVCVYLKGPTWHRHTDQLCSPIKYNIIQRNNIY